MNITVRDRTPRHLLLSMRPHKLWAYWMSGVMFIGLGFWSAWLLGRRITLECEQPSLRGAGTCALTRAILLKTRTMRFAEDQLWDAKRENNQLVLVTAMGDVHMPLVGATNVMRDTLAAQIRAFKHGQGLPRLSVHEDYRLVGAGLGLFLIVAGAFCVWAIESCVVELDRDRGIARIRGIRHFRKRREDVPLAQVRRAEKRSFVVRLRQYTRSWRVNLVTADRHIPLTEGAMFTDASADLAFTTINDWLEEKA